MCSADHPSPQNILPQTFFIQIISKYAIDKYIASCVATSMLPVLTVITQVIVTEHRQTHKMGVAQGSEWRGIMLVFIQMDLHSFILSIPYYVSFLFPIST